MFGIAKRIVLNTHRRCLPHRHGISTKYTYRQKHNAVTAVVTCAATFTGWCTLHHYCPDSMIERMNKLTIYGWTVIARILCAPSYGCMTVCAPSGYESKLRELKTILDELEKNGVCSTTEHGVYTKDSELETTVSLYREFLYLRFRYKHYSGIAFTQFLNKLLIDTSEDQNQLIHNVQIDMSAVYSLVHQECFFTMLSAVNWELFRVQPVRYIWNESGPVSFFGCVAMIGGLYKWMSLCKLSPYLAVLNLMNVFVLLKTYVPRRKSDTEIEAKYIRHMQRKI